MRCCLLTFIWIASFSAGATPEQAIEAAHRELWSRFVDEHNLILDYVGLKGEIERPTPEDCRDIKPSTLSWGVPNEVYMSQFFPAESAGWRMPCLAK